MEVNDVKQVNEDLEVNQVEGSMQTVLKVMQLRKRSSV